MRSENLYKFATPTEEPNVRIQNMQTVTFTRRIFFKTNTNIPFFLCHPQIRVTQQNLDEMWASKPTKLLVNPFQSKNMLSFNNTNSSTTNTIIYKIGIEPSQSTPLIPKATLSIKPPSSLKSPKCYQKSTQYNKKIVHKSIN